ncbi:MAG: hypothetical protein JWQ71_4435 [Pedosphaera sp.]|nr:hypothetical protein [Pedosphaera sp.]
MDLVTALGRLLRDGKLRDAFAAMPEDIIERLGVQAADRPALLAISAADLEAQAKVLLRKRYDAIAHLIPDTLSALGEKAWPGFQDYGRQYWPDGTDKEIRDATQFMRHCKQQYRKDVSSRELNKLAFLSSRLSAAAHWITDLQFRGRKRGGLQILIRRNGGRWTESILFLGF